MDRVDHNGKTFGCPHSDRASSGIPQNWELNHGTDEKTKKTSHL